MYFISVYGKRKLTLVFSTAPLFHQQRADFLLLSEYSTRVDVMAGPHQDDHGQLIPLLESPLRKPSLWCSRWVFSRLNKQLMMLIQADFYFRQHCRPEAAAVSFLIVVGWMERWKRGAVVFRDCMRHIVIELNSTLLATIVLQLLLFRLSSPSLNRWIIWVNVFTSSLPDRRPSCSWPGSGPRTTRRRTTVRRRSRRSSRSKCS